MANPTIAALRAASSAAPAGPSGPQALNYAWMNTPGRAVVVPVRSSVPPPPKRGRPPDPTTGLTANDFRKAEEPPLPPAGREGRVTNDTPGFVDGLTLPRDYNPTWNFNPNLLDEFMPRDFNAPIYSMPLPDPVVEQPVSNESPRREVAVSSSQMGMEPQLSDFQFDGYEIAPQVDEASAPAVEVAPETEPYSPQILDFEVPETPIVQQPKVTQPMQQVMPQVSPDLSLMEYIQPVPVAEPAPQAEVAPQPELFQQDINDMLMRYYMTQGFDRMEML